MPTIYPVLIAPAWRAGSTHTAYELAKAINVVLMTAAAVPFYLWARRLGRGWPAVVGTALFLALPSFAYTGTLMTENASFPLFMLSFLAIGVMLESPTLLRQLLALAAIGLASTVRVQALVLVLVLLVAIVLKLVIDLSAGALARSRHAVWQEARRYWLVLALLIGGAVAFGLWRAAEGRSFSSGLLGAYSTTTEVHYSIRDALRWSVYHAGELVLAVGVVPACAFIVLLGLFRAEWRATAAERAYLAVTISAIPFVLVEVGAFASRYSLRIEERNSFYLEPLLLLALVVWLARGLPRPPVLTSTGIAVAVGLVITIPLESLFNVSAETDTFGLIPFLRLGEALNGGVPEARTLIGIGAICAAVLFAAPPRKVAAWAVPAAVGGFLRPLLGKRLREDELHREPDETRRRALRRPELDRSRRRQGREGRVPLHDRHRHRPAHPLAVRVLEPQHAARLRRHLAGSVHPRRDGAARPGDGPDPPRACRPRRPTAGLGTSWWRRAVPVAGKLIAQSGFLSLYRVTPPLGLSGLVSGVTADAWTGSSASYTVFRGNRRRRLEVLVWRPSLTGPPPAHVTVSVGRPGSDGDVGEPQLAPPERNAPPVHAAAAPGPVRGPRVRRPDLRSVRPTGSRTRGPSASRSRSTRRRR